MAGKPGRSGGARPGAGRAKGDGGRKPGSVNKISQEIVAEAQKHGVKAIAALAKILAKSEAADSAVVSAAVALLDRGYGKPPQAVKHTGQMQIDGDGFGELARALDAAARNKSGGAGGAGKVD